MDTSPYNSGMRIAVIGGTRFIGHAAVVCAIERGHDVVVLHRGVHPNETAAHELLVARGDVGAIRAALDAARPDAVLDTRAMTRADADGTVESVRGLDATLVVLSSQDVYAAFQRLNGIAPPTPLGDGPIDEDAPLTIPFPFRSIAEHEAGPDYDKKEVEAVVARSVEDGRVPRAVLLRLPAVIGPRDPRRRFGAIVDALDRGERTQRCRGGASLRWTHADVRDVARAIVLACERTHPGARIYNVGEPTTPTMRERVDPIAMAMGTSVDWVEDDAAPAGSLGVFDRFDGDVVIDDRRVRRELGFRETTTAADRASGVVAALRASRPRIDPE